MLEKDPNYPFAATWLGRALALSGRLDDALRVFEDNKPGLGYVGYVYAVTGRRAEAEAIAEREGAPPQQQFLVYGGLRDKDRAFGAPTPHRHEPMASRHLDDTVRSQDPPRRRALRRVQKASSDSGLADAAIRAR